MTFLDDEADRIRSRDAALYARNAFWDAYDLELRLGLERARKDLASFEDWGHLDLNDQP